MPVQGEQQNGRDSPSFPSILFDQSETGADIGREAPEFFTDLNLDQIVAAITVGRDEYNLKPFFYTAFSHVELVNYRYEILRDLENQALLRHVLSFAREMRTMREHLAQAEKLHYKYQKQGWFLDAVNIYCEAVKRLELDLAAIDLRSRGFLAFREYLTGYTESGDFASLVAETHELRADLSAVRYSLRIIGKRVEAGPFNPDDPDYSADVLQTFEKFEQGAAREYQFKLSSSPDMNHVEAAALDLVARLYPALFSRLDEYCNRHHGYLHPAIAAFDREVQFYLACLEYVERIKRAGLPFCYPAVSDRSKEVYGRDVFDLALAKELILKNAPVVTNDFHLRDPERIFVVSGPNQGGKTTFARTFGQLHYLASIGCPVPAREARLFLFDSLFTHFEREEDIRDLRGKLEDDLLRIHLILQGATSNSILIMNESFLSTTLSDALFLGREILQQIIERDMLCVSVTFLEELASLGETTVSMTSIVNPKDLALRTFKILRRPPDGLAYAMAIAEKHRLTYEQVRGRISRGVKEQVAP